jgi:hypothetical protein
MVIKGKWFPIVHEALIGFLKNPAQQQSWLPLTLVTDMIYGSLLQSGKIALDRSASGVKDIIGEYIESQCGDAKENPEALLFAESSKRGKGTRITFRLNPKYREALNAPPPAAAPEVPADA